jgi:NTP pyrophosphatase (non-canonical NTP hydrolase)
MTRPFDELTARVARFRDDRDWARFHNPKDLALSIAIEAAELMELFQWKDEEEIREKLESDAGRKRIGEEMADVLILLLSAADGMGIDLYRATLDKIETNAAKYPVDKARGNARKYDEL